MTPRARPSQVTFAARDLGATLAFYRLLGWELADPTGVPHAAIRFGELSVEFDQDEFVALWDAGFDAGAGGRGVLVVSTEDRAAVDALYELLTGAGHRGRQPPYDAFWGARFAMVEDPDGRPVGLMSPVEDERRFWPPSAPPPGEDPGVPTVYEWAGGRAAFERWLGRFYDLVEDDELLAPLFGGAVGEPHRSAVVAWWCEVMGGPPDYTDHLGGYEHMLAKHRGLHLSADQRLRFVTLLSRAADDAELPADPEFRAAIMGYAEWGSRLAVHNSGDAPDVVAHAPVPRWGWGVAPPYTGP